MCKYVVLGVEELKELLTLQKIKKEYNGEEILRDVSLKIYEGQTTAIIGKNGSGKSTLLKIIGGILVPTEGEVVKHKKNFTIGYVPERVPSDIRFTPEEYLTFLGKIRGMDKKELFDWIEQLLELFEMNEFRKKKIQTFSKGMKQKIGIMQAMLEQTDLLILDEPLSGLDPMAQNDLETTLIHLKKKGVIIVLTCHEKKLLNRLGDRIVVIKNKEVYSDSIKKECLKRDTVVFEIHSEMEKDIKEMMPGGVTVQEIGEYKLKKRIQIKVNHTEMNSLLYTLLCKGAVIKSVIPDEEVEYMNLG